MKNHLSFTCVLAIALCVAGSFVSCETSKKQQKPAAYTPVTITEQTAFITTDISYPRFEDYDVLSAAVQEYVRNDYQKVRADAQDFKKHNADSAISYEYITTSAVSEDERFINVLLTTYAYTGGAHGNTEMKSFVWKKSDGAFQTVSQASGMSHEAIAKECRAALRQRDWYTGETWIESGTAADDGHLGIFTINGKKLTVYFNPYQVAPYSAGVQTVEIALP